MRLPADAMEAWLGSQKPKPTGAEKHRDPPEGSYEAWLRKQMEGRHGGTAAS